MWVWLEPLDVLLFRDSRPFTGGEIHRARSLFPPSPLTFQGAIRSLLFQNILGKKGKSFDHLAKQLRDKNEDPEVAEAVRILGGAEGFGNFQLLGPFLAKRQGNLEKVSIENIFFPPPLDLFQKENGKQFLTISPLQHSFPHVSFDPGSKGGLSLLWCEEKEARPVADFWLTKENLLAYLKGDVSNVARASSKALYVREERFGIELKDGTRTVEIGKLYMAEFIRLEKNHGFLVRVDISGGSDDLLAPLREGVLQLGGEARACLYRGLEDDPLAGFDSPLGGGEKFFKLYLATPAIFTKGWLPDFLGPSSLEGEVDGVQVRLVAAAVGKPMYIGGWDLAHNVPRELYPAVPPGSVYLFEISYGDAEKVKEIFHGRTKLQELGKQGEQYLCELAKIGFGLTFVGRWNYWEVKNV